MVRRGGLPRAPRAVRDMSVLLLDHDIASARRLRSCSGQVGRAGMPCARVPASRHTPAVGNRIPGGSAADPCRRRAEQRSAMPCNAVQHPASRGPMYPDP